MKPYDRRTVDSTGAFLVGELERFDQSLYAPLTSVTWHRDIDLRTDVSITDEVTSFALTNFAAPGGVNPRGKNWISSTATDIPGIMLDIKKKNSPMRLWGCSLCSV